MKYKFTLDKLGLDKLGLDKLGLDTLGLDKLGLDKIGLKNFTWEEFKLQKFKLNFTLKSLFFILLGITLYFAWDVLSHLNQKTDSQENNIRHQVNVLLHPLENELRAIQKTIGQQVTEFNNSPRLSNQQLQNLLSEQLEQHPWVKDFGFIANIDNRQVQYASPGLTTPLCQGEAMMSTASSQWRSGIHFNNKPSGQNTDIARLDYQYSPNVINVIECIHLSISLDAMDNALYGKTLTPEYHIFVDHNNRIAHHPNPHFVGQQVSDLLIIEPLMALLSDTDTDAVEPHPNNKWRLTSHITELDNGQWKVATFYDQPVNEDSAVYPRLLDHKKQAIEHLDKQLSQIRQSVQLEVEQDVVPGDLLWSLNGLLNEHPLVSEFYFALSQPSTWNDWAPADCLFSTAYTSINDGISQQECVLDPSLTKPQKGQWQVKVNNALSQLHFQYNPGKVSTDISESSLTAIGFTVDLAKAMGVLNQHFDQTLVSHGNHKASQSLHFIIFSQDNNIAYTADIANMIDTSGTVKGFAPIASVIEQHTGDQGISSKPNDGYQYAGTGVDSDTKYLFKQSTGQSQWVHNKSMDSDSWRIATVVETEVDFAAIEAKNKTWLLFVLSTLITMTLYTLLVLRVRDGEPREYWQLVVIFSVMSVITVGVVWGIQLNLPQPQQRDQVRLTDETGLYNAVAQKQHQYNTELPRKNAPIIPILALGLRVDSIDITDTGKINLIGLVWLKNTNCSKAVLLQNSANTCLSLPEVKLEFPGVEKIELTPHFNQPLSIVSTFNLEMNFPISSAIYPFERGIIPIRITTAGYNNPYRLVPDIAAYDMMNPLTKPGLDKELDLKGWHIFQSYFSYMSLLNAAKYSQGDTLYDGELTELYFNIEVGRKFLSPFIADMVPIIVITALLFLVLMTMTKNEQHMSELGFDASTMLGYCSGLFFVLIVAHVYLREKLNIDTIAYIEYFYFMMYFVILSISASAILFSSRFQQRFMTHEDGLMVKILFWPTIFIITLTFTFFSFY